MNVDIAVAQYQNICDLKNEVNELFNSIHLNLEEAPLRAAKLARMKVQDMLHDIKLQYKDSMIDSVTQLLDQCVQELEKLEHHMPELVNIAEDAQKLVDCSVTGSDSDSDEKDDDLDAIISNKSLQNTAKQIKTPTKEEQKFAEFMDTIKQAKAGKNEAYLQQERVQIAKKQSKKVGKNESGLLLYHYQARPFTNQELCDAIIIIMLGETGSGKSTLMSTLLNVVIGIEFDDRFRFLLVAENTGVGQYLSQTSSITEYKINAHNGYPPMILIDTPGFGDTQGIQRDQVIFKDLSKHLQNVNYVHAVCMVAKSSVNRITVYQNYIFDSVFNLFGKDVIENFICLLTFCDVGQPQILESLQSDKCDIKQHIDNIQPPWYLKLNNIGMFCKNNFKPGEEQDRSFNKQYFDVCKVGFDRFFAKFCNLKPKTLALTKQQLGIKEDLEFWIESMNKLVLECETHERNVQTLIESIKNNKDKINANQDFTIEQTRKEYQQTPLPGNQHTTTCLACNRTCHDNCGIRNDNDKRKCVAIDQRSGNCRHCSCIWSQHRNLPYILRVKLTKEIHRSEQMFQKYNVALDEKNRAETLLEKATNEQMMASLECLEYRESIANALRKLKTIALKKVDSTSTIDYIQMQIKTLEEQKPLNFERQVAQLKDHQRMYENLQKMIVKEKGSMQDVFGAFHCFKDGKQVEKSSLWDKTKKILYKRYF